MNNREIKNFYGKFYLSAIDRFRAASAVAPATAAPTAKEGAAD
jgi:hypothetical protein